MMGNRTYTVVAGLNMFFQVELQPKSYELLNRLNENLQEMRVTARERFLLVEN